MALPVFKPTQTQREWVQDERRTAAFIRAFWTAASARQRKAPGFLWFLTACAWTNVRADGTGHESTRKWRNDNMADYLGVTYQSITSLAAALSRAFPKVTAFKARRRLRTHTGITKYYNAIRPSTRRYVLRHAADLYRLFNAASSRQYPPGDKVRKVAAQLAKMRRISTPRGGSTSPFNPLSPVLACLDPHRRFPIMNQRTQPLLRAMGEEQDEDGASALVDRLIGSHGIHDSFDLDVYSQVAERNFRPVPRRKSAKKSSGKKLGHRVLPVKSEMDSLTLMAKRSVRIRKQHNKLTNQFRRAVSVKPEEGNFDLLMREWKRNRQLLIEAKTDWKGPTGAGRV
jgi:hypothetical protein